MRKKIHEDAEKDRSRQMPTAPESSKKSDKNGAFYLSRALSSMISISPTIKPSRENFSLTNDHANNKVEKVAASGRPSKPRKSIRTRMNGFSNIRTGKYSLFSTLRSILKLSFMLRKVIRTNTSLQPVVRTLLIPQECWYGV